MVPPKALLASALLIVLGVEATNGKNFKGLHSGRFEGKVCLVTGGTSGLGEHTAFHLAQEGCAVAITGRRADKGAKIIEELSKLSGKSKLSPSALFVEMDVSNADSVEAGIAKINATYGRLDSVFANAGIGDATMVAPVTPLDTWHRIMNTNVNGVYYTMRFSSTLLMQTGDSKAVPGGSIVLCSSILGQFATMGSAAYAASKHALEGLKKAAAQEFGTTIRVNNVGPSYTSSEALDPHMGTPFMDWVLQNQMDGRLAEQSEVSSVVAWLLSDDASYISAQTILVDGGATSSWSPHSQQKKLSADMAAFGAAAAAKSGSQRGEL